MENIGSHQLKLILTLIDNKGSYVSISFPEINKPQTSGVGMFG
jgi:hypothetical protein